MSNALSIAAATLTLRSLLGAVATRDYSALPVDARPVSQIDITTLPPDQARLADASRSRVNLFLYRTELSSSWRNMDLPRQTRPGEAAPSVMPLTLHYLLTAYAENDNELIGQVLLGAAMRLLHDHPVLSRTEIATALSPSELDAQIEQVRVTPQPLALDDLSKLWSGFQAAYRLSAAYQVGVLLIESERQSRAALPVLRRGAGNRGPVVAAAPAPTLLEIVAFRDPALPVPQHFGKPSAELGNVIVLRGTGFGADPMTARLVPDSNAAAFDLPLTSGNDETLIEVTLPADTDPGIPAAWPPGFYTIEVLVSRALSQPWTTNRLSLALAPRVTSVTPLAAPIAAQPFTLTLTCRPQIRAGQRVAVLLGARTFAPATLLPPADADSDTTLQVPVSGLEAGDHVVRLRVDGVDSLPVDFAVQPPQFAPAQTLRVTP